VTYLDVSERLTVEVEGLAGADWVVDVEVTLAEQVLVEVQLLQVSEKQQTRTISFEVIAIRNEEGARDQASQRRHDQRLLALLPDHVGYRVRLIFAPFFGRREELSEQIERSFRREELGVGLERRPDGRGRQHASEDSKCLGRDVALNHQTRELGSSSARRVIEKRDLMFWTKRF
jgi:hypothetical protein